MAITFLLVASQSFGQISIEPGPDVTAIDMVENIVGDGIQYSNVSFTGADASRGIFNNGATTNLGIGSGIFLTSGAGYNIPGPNASTSAGSSNGTPGDATLNSITTSTTYDAAVLEFDFIPESDTLRFKYVFGSEEYNEWVGSSFNDVFGYFVSGPDPSGGFYADKNIAIVPGTANTSVTINNVNNGYAPGGVVPTGPCTNCAYYQDNTGGVTLEYDGLTTVLVAWLLVVPCEEYSIKIGVADAGDGIYDSGVFIEENSFESPKIEVETDPFPQGVSDNMIEGCVEADIIFKLPSADFAPITVYFEVGGTADPGAYPDGDFEEEIPNSITFEEDTDTAVIHVAPVKDGIIEGDETLVLIIENTLGCIVRYDTVEFIIVDYIDMVTQMSPSTMICQGQQIEIYVNTYNGIPLYTYEWEGFSINNDTILVAPDTTTQYFVNVMDMCQDTITDSTLVTVFPLPEVDLGDSTVMCEGDTMSLNAGGGALAYFWNTGSQDSIIQVTQEGLYFVTVFGPGGCSITDSIYITEIILEVDLGNDQTICIGDTAVLDPGTGFENYLWQNGSIAQTFNATETGTYWVQVSMGGCTVTDSIYVFVDDPNIGISLGNDTTICSGDFITLAPDYGIYDTYVWSTGDTTPSISVTQPGTYELQVSTECGNAEDQITISNWPYPDPNLGEDINLCFGETTVLEPTFGFSSYTWQDNSTLPFYTVTQGGNYYVDVTDIHGCEGSDTVFVEVAAIVDLGEEDTLILCLGETLTLDAGGDFDFYNWSNGEFGVSSIEVDAGGWVKVDVNYVFGCPSADSVMIDDYPVPDAEITGEDMLCEGDTLYLSAPEGDYTYFWNNAVGDPNYMVTQGGNVSLKMTNVCGEDTDDLMVQLNPLPNVSLGADQLLFPGETVTLDAGQFESYMWNNNPSISGQYFEVKYEDVNGKDSVTVEVFDGFCKNSDGITIEAFNVQVPNVVTPNGDGKNDDFTPMTDGFTGINTHTITVFNRWGEKVWESNDFISGWDVKQNGNYVSEGTYFWVLEVSYGTDDVSKTYKGTLTVLGTGS